MSNPELRFVFLGLSITSSWGNGHATTYRGLVRGLSERGHSVLFLERDVPWYADNRDLPHPPYGQTALYTNLEALKESYAGEIRQADVVIVGSFVPQGVAVAEWVFDTAQGITAFYDIDTPVTLGKLQEGDDEYLTAEIIPRFDMYLSFTGGPILELLEDRYGAQRAYPLYCSVDPEKYYPQDLPHKWDLGYMGTYSPDRQPKVEQLLLEPARRWPEGRFTLAGPKYPDEVAWPENVDYNVHCPPDEHRAFYNAQRFTLNITRADMIRAGYAPSVRLFEAAACGTAIISDYWQGLETFFTPEKEILIASSADQVLHNLRHRSDSERSRIAERAFRRVMSEHTSAQRAAELERYVVQVLLRQNKVIT